MNLLQLWDLLHNTRMVIYDGYNGENDIPILDGMEFNSENSDEYIKELKNLFPIYGKHKVCILECACDCLYVWLKK